MVYRDAVCTQANKRAWCIEIIKKKIIFVFSFVCLALGIEK